MMNSPLSQRGRPRAGERRRREQRVLDAALAELIERGYDNVTMLNIARRAGASKETLYAWFGSREGLFRALIERNADRSAEQVRAALDSDRPPRQVLTDYATRLLTLLTSKTAVALNRAAMRSPELAALLLQAGRYRAGPLVEKYFSRLHAAGRLNITGSAEGFRLFYGLVVQDSQIRVLLGEAPPTSDEIVAQAAAAVERFFQLTDKK